jgi:soluble lytic murein transglycosylase-like protein
MKLVATLAALLVSASAYADVYLESSIVRAANTVGINVDILRAVCQVESGLNRYAYVHKDGGADNHAFGACQILLSTAKRFGFRDKNNGCEADFRGRKYDRVYKNCGLFGPYTNAYYAAHYLKWQLNRYNGDVISSVASYNTGSVKICRTGWLTAKATGKRIYRCQIGGLLNQRYVDRVMRFIQ